MRTKITIARQGYAYRRSIVRDGKVISLNTPISRELAMEIVRQNPTGEMLGDFTQTDFDTALARQWTWRAEVVEEEDGQPTVSEVA